MISDITPHHGQPGHHDDDDGSADAIDLLSSDHDDVKEMFAEYEELLGEDGTELQRGRLVAQLCEALTAHSIVEEEIFYPAAREAIGDADLIDRAEHEHAEASTLIERLQAMEPSDDLYDATVLLLQSAIEHHVREEEGELFPLVRESALDLAALGAQMIERKEEVFVELQDNQADG